jgi:hypothetical protein
MRLGVLLGLGMAAAAMSASPALADRDRGRGWHGSSHYHTFITAARAGIAAAATIAGRRWSMPRRRA